MKLTVLLFAMFAVTATSLAQQPSPVPAKAGVVSFNPVNSKINFVGIHEGPKPDPRKGGFSKFNGSAMLDQEGALKSIAFDIETGSLWTEIPKLTNHLKSPDFFDVRQFPQAAFQSTAIAPTEQPGGYLVSGNFALLGQTRSITVPATVNLSGSGLTLTSNFKLDRTQFGMNYGQGKVHKDVTITVVIGEATAGGSGDT